MIYCLVFQNYSFCSFACNYISKTAFSNKEVFIVHFFTSKIVLEAALTKALDSLNLLNYFGTQNSYLQVPMYIDIYF